MAVGGERERGRTGEKYHGRPAVEADEVNFWQPSAKPPFVNAPVGMPFLFKLKKPYNHMAVKVINHLGDEVMKVFRV